MWPAHRHPVSIEGWSGPGTLRGPSRQPRGHFVTKQRGGQQGVISPGFRK